MANTDKYSYFQDLIYTVRNATPEERAHYAYWKKAQKNHRIDEERVQYTYEKHTIPVGEVMYTKDTRTERGLEDQIEVDSAVSWLELIENPKLHQALASLRPKELQFLYLFFSREQTQAEFAAFLGIKQAAVSRRLGRIMKKIKNLI